jgi:hypothetical protein
MQYAHGFVIVAALGLGACNGGGQSATPPANVPPSGPARPSPVSIDGFTNFDFLGPLLDLAVRAEDGNRLPLESCYAPAYSEPLAACVDNVMLDGFQASVRDLRAGQVAEIHGSLLATGLAARGEPIGNIDVDIRRVVVGPIEAIDISGARLVVLGQTVYASYSDVSTVSVGDTVAVYGHFTSLGQLVASLVERYSGEPLFLLRGVLAEPTVGHLTIGAMEVDITNAVRENFPGNAPAQGDAVLVLSTQAPENGILPVETIRCTGKCATENWTNNWENGSVRGFITGWRSGTDFDVDGRSIDLRWCECAYGPTIPIDSFVNIFLYGGNADVTRATNTENTLRLVGTISDIDAKYGEIVVLGFRVQISPATQIASSSGSYFDSSLSWKDLRVGDHVDISGDTLGAEIRAGNIILQGENNWIQSLVSFALDTPAIEIAGRSILTDDSTQVDICRGGGSITLEQFFATEWSDFGASLSIVFAEPYTEPLTAQKITICAAGLTAIG